MTTTTDRPTPIDFTPQLMEELKQIPMLASLSASTLQELESLQLIELPGSEIVAREGEPAAFFWVLLSGDVDAVETLPDGNKLPIYTYHPGSTFGEVALLANLPNTHTLRAANPIRLLQFDDTAFWRLMTDHPEIRRAILRNMAIRVQKMQHRAVQQEKMATLGTLAAGLMHELNNPGAAASRAASQLRANFTRMQELSGLFNERQMSSEQKLCLDDLKHRAITATGMAHLNSVEQSDAEEALSEWLDAADVPDAWKLAPTLTTVGLRPSDLECVRHVFSAPAFIDAVSFVEAIVSSSQLLSTIEESIGRVTVLVKAVKTYAYEGSGQLHTIGLNESIQATLVMLGHKFREKQIHVEHDLAANLPTLRCACKGLNQIWTNLLDNAIDAVPTGGTIQVKTWAEPDAGDGELAVRISDNGPGIPADVQAHIFDPFFTTKDPGVGTGLGLGIVGRIVEQNHGTIRFTSSPGQTEFLIRLPVGRAS